MNLNLRVRRWLIVGLALLVVFSVGGFLVAPPILKGQLEKRMSALLGRRVTVEKVRLNPYALSITLENFAIQERDGKSPFVGWTRLYVNFDAVSSLWGEWVLSEIALDGFNAHVAINADQSYNFSDLLAKLGPPTDTAAKPAAPAPAAAPPRPVRIVTLKVSGAAIAFSDASRKTPFATKVGPLTFSLTEFRTVSERGAPYRFEAVTEANEKLSWKGTLRADPLSSAGDLTLDGIVLAKYAPYYADQLQADIAAGTLSVSGRYEANFAPNQRVLRLADGALLVRGLKIVERASKAPVVELPDFSVSGVEADAVAMKARVDRVALNGGHVQIRRDKDGAINLLTMLVPPTGQMPPPATPPPNQPKTSVSTATAAPPKPDILLREVAFKGLQFDITDDAAPRPAQLSLRDLELSLQNVTLAEGAQVPLHLGFALAAGGTFRLDGSVAIAPVKANLAINIADFNLLPFSPYLEQFVNARLTQGLISAKLEARADLPDGKPVDAKVSGDILLQKIGLVDAAHNEELAGVGELKLQGLRASTAPDLTLALEEIKIGGPYARVIVNADRTLNVAGMPRTTPPPAASGATPAVGATSAAPANPKAGAMPRIDIGRVLIADGDYRFSDRSVEPNVRTSIGQFGGEISGLSSTTPGKGAVNLKGLVDGAGPVAIVGKVDPFGPKMAVDLKVDFKNVDLVPLSPYSGKFAGYELARGKLAVDVKLGVDGRKIDAANVITLNQFTFGSPVKSADATTLPVRLGVALLKDLDGKIVIDVPVQGDLDDPNFQIGRVVLRVVVNLLTKAAVSPFTLLGAAFGGGDELAFQEFAPGSADIQPSEVKKLETMIKALTNRPGLSVGLEGNYDAAADTYALRRVKLNEQIRRAIWEKRRQSDPNIPPPNELSISPEESVAMLKQLFDEKFPPGTKFGTPIPPPPVVAAPPAPPQGMMQRIVSLLTLKAQRDKRATERENARLASGHEKDVAAAISTGRPAEEMSARLAETMAVDDNDLRALAQARAQRVRDYLAGEGKIAGDRLFLAQEKADPASARSAAKGPRVFLTLQ